MREKLGKIWGFRGANWDGGKFGRRRDKNPEFCAFLRKKSRFLRILEGKFSAWRGEILNLEK